MITDDSFNCLYMERPDAKAVDGDSGGGGTLAGCCATRWCSLGGNVGDDRDVLESHSEVYVA